MAGFNRLLVSVMTLALSSVAGGQVAPPRMPPRNFSVSGKVSDSEGNPLDAAAVTLQRGKDTSPASLTGADGHFNLGDFPEGDAIIHVRRLGYEPFEMKISVGQDASSAALDLSLRELPQKLEEVLVKSDEEGRLREFYDHKNKRNNFGRYFDRADIRKQNPSYASELLRTVPGMQVQASSAGGNIIRMRGCKPLVWVDGQRIPGAELDDVVRPADIAGLEVYSSNAGIPAEYMDRNNGACGIIVVWTKSQ